MRTPLIALLPIALLVVAAGAAAQTNVDCPPHPRHCNIGIIELPDGSTLSAEAIVEATASVSAAGQVDIHVGASGRVIVELTWTGSATGASLVVNATVNATAGVEVEDEEKSATLANATPTASLSFPFETDPYLTLGDVLYIPVSVETMGIERASFATFRVAEPLDDLDTTALLVGGGAVGGIVAGSGLTYFALRDRIVPRDLLARFDTWRKQDDED